MDLTGLPPTPEEVDAFVNDTSPDAYEKAGRPAARVAALRREVGPALARPGPLRRDQRLRARRRQAARLALPRLRHQAFNADKPYDRFVSEQLAGDELPGRDPDAIIATGFYRLGRSGTTSRPTRCRRRYDELDDIVATTGQAFLGLTVDCARCHDHKIDPIPQKDYYRLLAFFHDIRPYFRHPRRRGPRNLTDITPPSSGDVRGGVEEARAQRRSRRSKRRQMADRGRGDQEDAGRGPARRRRGGPADGRASTSRHVLGEEGDRAVPSYRREDAELEQRAADARPGLALSVNDCDVPPPDARPDPRQPRTPGAKVEPGFPEVLGGPTPAIPDPPGTRSRAAGGTVLADWVASTDNPLTARVMVNRVWQYHFGRGIVPHANDFGKFGEPPTHPELAWLDYPSR